MYEGDRRVRERIIEFEVRRLEQRQALERGKARHAPAFGPRCRGGKPHRPPAHD